MSNLFKNVLKASGLLLCSTVISCSSSTSNNTPAATGSLHITVPATYPSNTNLAIGMPVVVSNYSNVTVNNIHYSFKINTAGLSESSIPTNCNSIAAGEDCVMMLPITQATQNGTVQLQADYAGATSNVASNSTKNLTATTATSSLASFEPMPTSNATGANGITLLGYELAVEDPTDGDNDADIIITAVVASESAGNFNTINLVDSHGTPLGFAQEITGQNNSGTNLAQGRVLSFLLHIPVTSSTEMKYAIAPQTMLNNAVVSTGNVQKTISVISKSSVQAGNIVQSPSNFSLNENKASQVVYITNNGASALAIKSIPKTVQDLVIESDNCSGKSLAVNDVCSYNVLFDTKAVVASHVTIPVEYNNFKDRTSYVSVAYAGANPRVSISIEPSPLNDFITTAANPTTTQVISITNTSLTVISPQLPTLPSGLFSLSTPFGGNPCFVSGDNLNPGETCSFDLTYTNAAETAGVLNLVLPFTYNIGDGSKIFNANLTADYITYSSANLLVSNVADGTQDVFFGNIVNNNVDNESQLISVYNTGSAPATNLLINLSSLGSAMGYTTAGVNSPCGATLAAGATCFVKATFGPTAQDASKSIIHTGLDFNYTPGTNQDTRTSVIDLHGSIITYNSADLVVAMTSNTFEAGAGTFESKFLVEQNRSALPTVTYTVTNIATSAAAVATKVTATLSNPDWSMTGGTCSNATLDPNGGQCTIVLTLNNTVNVGPNNLELNSVVLSYNDPEHLSGTSQSLNGTLFANVAPLATISINGSGVGFQAATDGSYLVESNITNTLTFTLNGGVSNSYVITPTVTDGTGSATISGSCAVTSANPTCTIQLSTSANNLPGSADFSISFVTSPARQITPSTMQFHTWSGVLPDINIKFYVENGNYLYANPFYTSNVERLSILNNGNIYASVIVVNYNNTGQNNVTNQITFNNGYVYLADSFNGVSSIASCLVNSVTGIFTNCVTESSLPPTDTGDTFSGYPTMAIYNSPTTQNSYMYLKGTAYDDPLYKCVLNNNRFESAACVSQQDVLLPNSMYALDLLVTGNTLLIVNPQTGLNKCSISPTDGQLSNCTLANPTITGTTRTFANANAHNADAMSIIGNYFYTAMDGVDSVEYLVCPAYDLANIGPSTQCFPINGVGSHDSGIFGLNGYVYDSSLIFKFTQNPDGTLTKQGAAFGY